LEHHIEYRFAEGRLDRSFDLASELVRLRVDVIVAPGTALAQGARRATTTIPIVLVTAGNPVGDGLIKSLARSGGNVTGLTMAVSQEIGGKLLELLKEAVPTVPPRGPAEKGLCSENPAPGFGSRSGCGLEGDAITVALQRLNARRRTRSAWRRS
jgi:hypothetical protein